LLLAPNPRREASRASREKAEGVVVLRKGERIPERREQEEGHPIMKMGMRQPLSGHFFFILRKGAGTGVLAGFFYRR
jgi:hypothetical protein